MEVHQLGDAIKRLCEEASKPETVIAALLAELVRFGAKAGFSGPELLVVAAKGFARCTLHPTGEKGGVDYRKLLAIALIEEP